MLKSTANLPFFITILLFASCITSKKESMNLKNVKNYFPETVEEISKKKEQALNDTQACIKKILSIKGNRTWLNTAKAFDQIIEKFLPISNALEALKELHPSHEIREETKKALLELQNFFVSEVSLNVKLYTAFKDYVENYSHKENLNADELYFLNEQMEDFRRAGLNLPAEKLKQVLDLTKELNKLSIEFSSNIASYDKKVKIKKSDLQGLSEKFIDSLDRENDFYLLNIDTPTYLSVLEHCVAEGTRKKMYMEYCNIAYPQNLEVLEKIVNKRDQLAKLLGFKSYAELEISDKMAKTPEAAKKFIKDLFKIITIKAKQEINELSKDNSIRSLIKDEKVEPWDLFFVIEEYKKKNLNLDENKVQEYFPVQQTLNALLDIYQQFFNLTFKRQAINELWHPDLELISIYDSTNKLIGNLILDLYPRDNKYKHACEMTIESPIKNGPPALIIIVSNFCKPNKNIPALLKYEQVRTFFHEFGHAMHSLLGRTELNTFSGTRVKRDFVETPSQTLEGWMTNKEILKKISYHYETTKSLPDELIEQIIKLEKLNSGIFYSTQASYALISLNAFSAGENKDLKKIWTKAKEECCPFLKDCPISENKLASFGHLDGYGAGYYGYLWSLIFACDIFSKIKEYGLLNSAIGTKLTQDIFSQGGSKDPEILIETFLSRKPSFEAFFKEKGLR